MFVGSSVLVLVKVMFQLTGASSPRQHRHSRQRSDELMEDLQLQLGDSFVTYMNINVSYSHSAFPPQPAAATEVSALHTKLTTTAEATVKIHNAFSPWSPQPVMARDCLLPLIERHWGSQKASEVMLQMLARHPTPMSIHNKTLLEGLEHDATEKLLDYPHSPTISPRQSLQGAGQAIVKPDCLTNLVREKKVSCGSGIGMARTHRRASKAASLREGEGGQMKEEVSNEGCSTTAENPRDMPPVVNNGCCGLSDGGKDDKSKEKKQGAVGDAKGKKEAGLWAWAAWF